ncbi:hypothetical protein HDF09_001481 [Edaphobacter lichenicola]|uniref:Uncharacterized protein n=1 Tax=Tunturiibacter empetritectus TaxID=3069691 RepID=A0A7W8MR23_9BACT|nr:hypothetical protein [Edaphobacter lichenicola]
MRLLRHIWEVLGENDIYPLIGKECNIYLKWTRQTAYDWQFLKLDLRGILIASTYANTLSHRSYHACNRTH